MTNYPTEFKGHKEKITCLALAADGILITASEDKSLRSWDTTHGTTLRQYKGHKDQILAISIVDEHIYSASLDGYILRWNIEVLFFKIMINLDLTLFLKRLENIKKLLHGQKEFPQLIKMLKCA